MATNHPVVLLSNASATGSWVVWPGGYGVVDLCGTVGGATVTLQTKGTDGSTAHTVGAYTTFTATGQAGFGPIPAGTEIRMAVSGGSPSALYSNANRV